MLLENIVCVWQMKTHLRAEYNQSGETVNIILIINILTVFGMLYEVQAKGALHLKCTHMRFNKYRVKNTKNTILT